MADLGNKHECLSCGTKFYDLGRSQLVCPSCGGDQEELAKEEKADEGSATAKSKKKGKAKSKPKAVAKKTAKSKTAKSKKTADPKEEPQSTEE